MQIGDDDAAGEGDLIDRNELSTDVNRGNLGNVKRRDKRSDADGGAGNDPGDNQPCRARRQSRPDGAQTENNRGDDQ